MSITLYHGTLASLSPAIQREGLKPRGRRPSHDEYMQSASLPKFVYFTSKFERAVEHACRISERTADGAGIVVLELELHALVPKKIYPDEDYLSEVWNSDFLDWTLKEQLKYMERHRDDWEESLNDYSIIAYKGEVPASALSQCRVPRWLEQGYRRYFQETEARGQARMQEVKEEVL